MEPLDNCFLMMKRILQAPGAVPYTEVGEIESDQIKGLIFKDDFSDLENEKRIAYLCSPSILDVSQLDQIKAENNLHEVTLVATSSKDEDVNGFLSFYNKVQSFKDSWYQSAICWLANCAPSNPTLIQIINHCIKGSPYPPQPAVKELLKKILSMHDSGVDLMLIAETASAVAHLKYTDLKDDIFLWIERMPRIKQCQKDHGALRGCTSITNLLVTALGNARSRLFVL